MEVEYESTRLEALFNDQRRLRRTYGGACVKKLRNRMSSIVVESTLEQLGGMPGDLHPLSGNRHGQFAMDLDGGWRLILRPREPVPLRPDGGIDRTLVSGVVIVEISAHYKP